MEKHNFDDVAEIVKNIWVRRALLTCNFSDEGAQIFSKHSKEFIEARKHFLSLDPNHRIHLMDQVRAIIASLPKKSVSQLLREPGTIILS